MPSRTGGWASFGMGLGKVVMKFPGHSMALPEGECFDTITNNEHGR